MPATGFHNKVERVFLVMHIGFVGVYSGSVNKGGFLVQTAVFFLVYSGFFLVQDGGFLVGTRSEGTDTQLLGSVRCESAFADNFCFICIFM